MSSRRLVLLALVAAALVPGAARAAVPVALYPLRLPGLSADQRADVHALVKSGLLFGTRRGALRPRTPLLLAAMCTEPPAPDCLARLADGGLILVGRGERRSGTVLITAALYDRNGAKTRDVRFVIDLVIENLRPVDDALAQLESELDGDGTVAGAPKTPPVAEQRIPRPPVTAPVRPPPAAVAASPKPAASAPVASARRSLWDVPLPPPPAALRGAKPATSTSHLPTAGTPAPAPAVRDPARAPAAATAPAIAARAPIDVSAPSEPPPVWKRQAGPFFTILGGALLASGAAVAVANRSLSRDLDAKRAAGTLTAADRASYDRVDRYNVLSTVLLAGGGVSVAAGTWLWITAPARPGDPALAVAGGRF